MKDDLLLTTVIPLYLELHGNGTPEGTYVCDQFGNKVEGVIGVEYGFGRIGNPVVTLQLSGMQVFIEQRFKPIDMPVKNLTDISSLVQEAESRRDQIAAGTIKSDPIVLDEHPRYKELDI